MADAVKGDQQRQREHEQQTIREEKGIAEHKAKQDRQKRGEALLIQWRALSIDEQRNKHQALIEQTTSTLHRRRLRAIDDLNNPPLTFLLQLPSLL